MESSITSKLKHAWNAFMNRAPTKYTRFGYSTRPDRYRSKRSNERTIVTAIINRIAMDTASLKIRHVRLDNDDRFIEEIDDSLNQCLSLEANIDQTGRAFIQDVTHSMLDEGCVAIVPVDTERDPNDTEAYEICTMRAGKITAWYPKDVKVELYNENTGRKEEVILSKRFVSIVENPLYATMNETNSTLQRLIRKLNLLDVIDEQSSSGKLDLIIQLPYTVKSNLAKERANDRKKSIEEQLTGSKYGIAYIDATEKITQLNRPVENNLMKQIEYLTSMLYSQLGITAGILDGTADEQTMLNYYNRTIEPIISAITDEMKRKFLSKTARTQKQSICFFRDPFKLVPTSQIPEIADKLTRNEVMTSNEVRQIMGMKPSKDPAADELRNKNLNQKVEKTDKPIEKTEEEENQNEKEL